MPPWALWDVRSIWLQSKRNIHQASRWVCIALGWHFAESVKCAVQAFRSTWFLVLKCSFKRITQVRTPIDNIGFAWIHRPPSRARNPSWNPICNSQRDLFPKKIGTCGVDGLTRNGNNIANYHYYYYYYTSTSTSFYFYFYFYFHFYFYFDFYFYFYFYFYCCIYLFPSMNHRIDLFKK